MTMVKGTSLSQQLLQLPLGQLAVSLDVPRLIRQTKQLPSGQNLRNGKDSQLQRITRRHHEHRARTKGDHADPSPHTMILMNHTKRETTSKRRGLRQGKIRRDQLDQAGRHHQSISEKTYSTIHHLSRTMTIACHLQHQHSLPSTKSQSQTHHALLQACRHNSPHDLQDQVPFRLTR